ncbi:hypothetical protein B6I21_02720 [candidate division KSB1 bacterium 4572_119]|nr:MAG: hypothetical protein B6I21_02720 [candidate division KSB1 bacterium 4572_119]
MQNAKTSQEELRGLLRRLNPNRPASLSHNTLPRIERVGGSLSMLSTHLKADQYTKALIAGHIGVGKSTELMYLAESLKNEYFVIFRSVSSVLGAHNTSVPTLLVFLLEEAVRRWNAEFEPMPKELVRNIGEIFGVRADVGSGMHLLLSLIGLQIPSESQTKKDSPKFSTPTQMEDFLKKILQKISLRYFRFEENQSIDISDLALAFENLVNNMAEYTNKPILIIIDDLDKIGDEKASLDLFVQRAMAWIRLPCAIVATMPVDMYFHDRAREIDHIWGEVSILDPLDTPSEAAELTDPALSFYLSLMKEIGGEKYFSAKQINRLARASGGIVRDFVHLCALSVNYVLDTGQLHVKDWHIDAVERALSEKFQSRLDDNDYTTIVNIVKKQGSAKAGAQLIRSGALLCKRDENKQRVYQTHPLVEKLVNNYLSRQKNENGAA